MSSADGVECLISTGLPELRKQINQSRCRWVILHEKRKEIIIEGVQESDESI